jgi:hypothetical protein
MELPGCRHFLDAASKPWRRIWRNDARYVSGNSAGTVTNVLEFPSSYDSDAPFCLIVSLVNPHDVFIYPRDIGASGYDVSAFDSLPIELPPTYDEDLSTKPSVQGAFRESLNNVWPFTKVTEPVLYSRFYAYLNTLADAQLTQILDLLDARGLTQRTLIVRVADHGELGLAHCGLRQKDHAAYEEMIHIPMIFSNPVLFPRPLETNALASLIPWIVDEGREALPLRIQRGLCLDPCHCHQRGQHLDDLVRDPLETVKLAHGRTPIRYQFERIRLENELLGMMTATGTQPGQLQTPT